MQERTFSLHVTQPSTDARISPEHEPSPSFLSSSALPAPSTHRSAGRRSSASPSAASALWAKLSGGAGDYALLGGGGGSGRRRRSSSSSSSRERPASSSSGHKYRRSTDSSSSPFADGSSGSGGGWTSMWSAMSLSRPSTLLLPGSVALCAVAVLVSAYDALAAFSRARALVVDPSFRQLDQAGEQPSLGWRAADGWWAGGQAQSPWDFDAADGDGLMRDGGWGGRADDGRVRILFLIGFHDYIVRVNSHTPELISAAFAHPHVETDVWGPNWGGWDGDKTLSQNLKARRVWRDVVDANGTLTGERALKRAGAGYYDLVWTISDIFKTDSPTLDAPGHGTLFAQQLGDCHSDDCINKWYAPLLNITVVKYPHELEDMFSPARIQAKFPGMAMHLFGNSPDSANRWDFFPPERWEDKTVDMQGFGYDGSFYPIRTTVTNARKGYAKSGTDIMWHAHPGYSMPEPNGVEAPEFYLLGSPLREQHRKLRNEFAGAMRDTKICVFDSSLERKMIRKWAQALLSGCVIASDIPTDREDELRAFMIELKQGWSIETINDVLKDALADQDALKRKAMLGFAYARSYLTNSKKVEGMLRLWHGYKFEGWRGYDFPTGHSLLCRQYWSGDDAYRPPWCKPGSLMGLEGEWDRAHERPGS